MTNIVPEFKHFVAGSFASGYADSIKVYNPANGVLLGAIPDGDENLVNDAVAAARAAQDGWAARPANERGQYLRRMAKIVRENTSRLARVVATEQGKVLSLAEMEVFMAAEYLDYMAEWARRIEGEIISSDRARENIFLFRRPMGVVAAILPWNFPFFMIVRKAAPALVTGNTVVMKPSEETPYSAYEFAKIAAQVELPTGVFNLVGGLGQSVGQALVGHPGIDMVSFTGSSAAGSAIMANAARNITKVNLELGGKAPSIVLADANIDLAVTMLKVSKSINSGQACNSTERVFVERAIYAEFSDKLAAAVASISFGDPLGATPVDMGPLINRASVERIGQLVDDARANGAEILTGGSRGEIGDGCYFRPTVIANTNANMQILKREIFGPVILVEPVDDLDEAIKLANANEYGLSSSIFTSNLGSAMHAVNSLKYGETYVNRENFETIQGFHAGVRRSGIGGTDGKHGLYEYMHTQVAYIQN
ncbi:aldehyde dehydrogenase [Noviherbaspirillum sedimenti]|uniref:Aldehyde dehydrogenase n=1 Tax=Noviherbaspirillum sedimenti TaxID=2320865 RepID=A0A3A3GLK0_9BURK|nr:aldehyde dehydrogenase [Noviherbaspirillum sedimenti]RJG01850.1 aldehyde dehydrogenase [Noviherbaspirillum sedimenti]